MMKGALKNYSKQRGKAPLCCVRHLLVTFWLIFVFSCQKSWNKIQLFNNQFFIISIWFLVFYIKVGMSWGYRLGGDPVGSLGSDFPSRLLSRFEGCFLGCFGGWLGGGFGDDLGGSFGGRLGGCFGSRLLSRANVNSCVNFFSSYRSMLLLNFFPITINYSGNHIRCQMRRR